MSDNLCTAVITVDAANARVQPRTGTSIVGVARLGDRLPVQEVTQPTGDPFFWVQVIIPSNNLAGWIRGDLVQLTGNCAAFNVVSNTATPAPTTSPTPSPTPTPTPSTPTEATVLIGDCQGEITTMSATVRSAPSLSGSIRGFVNRGTKFVIVEVSPADNQGFRWVQCDFNGAPGWIREDLVKTTGDCLDARTHVEPTPPATTPQPVSGCIAFTGLPETSIRAQASASATRLGGATKGSQFTVRGITPKQGDGFTWIQIDFNGQTGFVRSDLVVLRGDCSAFTNDDRLPRPVSGRTTQGFRPTNNPTHNGIDFGTSGPQELYTAIPSVVDRAHQCANCAGNPPNIMTSDPTMISRIFSDANWGFGYGNHVILKYAFNDIPRSAQEQIARLGGTNQNVYVLFAHLTEFYVQVGQTLAANTLFGKTGNTGFSSAEHLHMEVGYGTAWGRATKIHPAILFNMNFD